MVTSVGKNEATYPIRSRSCRGTSATRNSDALSESTVGPTLGPLRTKRATFMRVNSFPQRRSAQLMVIPDRSDPQSGNAGKFLPRATQPVQSPKCASA